MSKFGLLQSLLFFGILFYACSNQSSSQNKNTSEKVYDSINFSYEEPKKDSNSYFKMKYSLLDINGFEKAVNDSINTDLRGFIFNVEPELAKPLKQLVEESKSSLLEEYKTQLEDFPENYNGYDHDIDQHLVFKNKQFISFEVIRYSFSAGAHGMGWTDFIHHDLKTGKRLYLKDFLKSEALLVKLAGQNFRKQMELGETADLEKNGFWFSNNKFHINENFCFRNDSIEIIFNQYEVAPFSMGQITLKVPIKNINNDIKAEMFKE